MTARQLAKRLDEYGLKSQNINMGGTARPKGYYREPFEDIFARYLPAPTDTPKNAATPLRNAETPENTGISEVADHAQDNNDQSRAATSNALESFDGSVIADKTEDSAPEERAAIMEYGGGMSREEAERQALQDCEDIS